VVRINKYIYSLEEVVGINKIYILSNKVFGINKFLFFQKKVFHEKRKNGGGVRVKRASPKDNLFKTREKTGDR